MTCTTLCRHSWLLHANAAQFQLYANIWLVGLHNLYQVSSANCRLSLSVSVTLGITTSQTPFSPVQTSQVQTRLDPEAEMSASANFYFCCWKLILYYWHLGPGVSFTKHLYCTKPRKFHMVQTHCETGLKSQCFPWIQWCARWWGAHRVFQLLCWSGRGKIKIWIAVLACNKVGTHKCTIVYIYVLSFILGKVVKNRARWPTSLVIYII